MRFDIDEPLPEVLAHLTWIEARLAAEGPPSPPGGVPPSSSTSDLAASLATLIARASTLIAEEQRLSLDTIRANAEVDAADAVLDDLVEGLAGALRQAFSDPDGSHFRRYFSTSAREVVRLGLASQLEVVRGWPGLLTEDGEPAIVAGAEPVAAAIARGDTAVAARREVAVRSATFRVDRRLPFVEDCSAVVSGIAEALGERAQGRPEGWVSRFLFPPHRT